MGTYVIIELEVDNMFYDSKKIQICRAIAIIAVVGIHTCGYGIVSLLIRPILNFSVAAFLFISGLLTKEEIGDLKGFYKKRIARVLVPYLLWSIIYAIANKSYGGFIYKLLTGQCCSIYYYILVYIQLSLLAPLINKFVRSKYWELGFVVSPIAIIIQYIFTFSGNTLSFPWNANLFFVWLIYFYFGMCIRSKRIEVKNVKIKIIIMAFLVQYIEVAFWAFIMNNGSMATTQIKISAMLTSLVVICIGYNWITNNQKLNDGFFGNVLINIGDISFGIYLTHVLLIRHIEPLLSKIFFPFNTLTIVALEVIIINLVRKIMGKKGSKWLGLI